MGCFQHALHFRITAAARELERRATLAIGELQVRPGVDQRT
jgi:hypothetical protein